MAEEYNERNVMKEKISQNLISRRDLLKKGIGVSVAASALTMTDVVMALGASGDHERSNGGNQRKTVKPHTNLKKDCGGSSQNGGWIYCPTCHFNLLTLGTSGAFLGVLHQIGNVMSGLSFLKAIKASQMEATYIAAVDAAACRGGTNCDSPCSNQHDSGKPLCQIETEIVETFVHELVGNLLTKDWQVTIIANILLSGYPYPDGGLCGQGGGGSW